MTQKADENKKCLLCFLEAIEIIRNRFSFEKNEDYSPQSSLWDLAILEGKINYILKKEPVRPLREGESCHALLYDKNNFFLSLDNLLEELSKPFNFLEDNNFLPSKEEINIYNTLDEQYAVKDFLGKNQREAYLSYKENPDYYSGSIFWMGIKARNYYLPILEAYASNDLDSPGDISISTIKRIVGEIAQQRTIQENYPSLISIKRIANVLRKNSHKLKQLGIWDESDKKKWEEDIISLYYIERRADKLLASLLKPEERFQYWNMKSTEYYK